MGYTLEGWLQQRKPQTHHYPPGNRRFSKQVWRIMFNDFLKNSYPKAFQFIESEVRPDWEDSPADVVQNASEKLGIPFHISHTVLRSLDLIEKRLSDDL